MTRSPNHPAVRPIRLLACAALLLLPIRQAAATEAQPVEIRFQAMVGDQPFACGQSYDGIGTTGARITPADFRLYVSEVALIGADGTAVPVTLDQDGVWQHQTVALLDFEDKSGPCANGTTATRDRITGTVPAGRYTGLRFTLGVPFALNHADATLAPSPLNLTSMFWNWQGGYKFVRIDFDTPARPTGPGYTPDQPGHIATGYSIHLGSTGCASGDRIEPPASCANPNRPVIAFASFDPATQVVAADLAALLVGTNVETNQPDTQLGCMSAPTDGDCPAIMARFGLPFGSAAPGEQAFFRIR